MSYQIKDPSLNEVYQRYRADSEALRDIASDVALLRALIERSLEENADAPSKSLKTVEGSLAVLLKLESKLMQLDIERANVLSKEAIVELGQAIIAILSDALRNHVPQQRFAIVDEVAPLIASAIAEARNDE